MSVVAAVAALLLFGLGGIAFWVGKFHNAATCLIGAVVLVALSTMSATSVERVADGGYRLVSSVPAGFFLVLGLMAVVAWVLPDMLRDLYAWLVARRVLRQHEAAAREAEALPTPREGEDR